MQRINKENLLSLSFSLSLIIIIALIFATLFYEAADNQLSLYSAPMDISSIERMEVEMVSIEKESRDMSGSVYYHTQAY